MNEIISLRSALLTAALIIHGSSRNRQSRTHREFGL